MIPTRERLIVALDVPTSARARTLVEALGDSVHFYKIGLELFMTRDSFDLIDWLRDKEEKSIRRSQVFRRTHHRWPRCWSIDRSRY